MSKSKDCIITKNGKKYIISNRATMLRFPHIDKLCKIGDVVRINKSIFGYLWYNEEYKDYTKEGFVILDVYKDFSPHYLIDIKGYGLDVISQYNIHRLYI